MPGPVKDFEVHPSGASSVVLRFSQPEYPNGVITAYMVTYEGRKPVSNNQRITLVSSSSTIDYHLTPEHY